MRHQKTDTGHRAEIGARYIYILPTGYGLIYAVLLGLMLLGAVNYANNPAHLLTFLLAAAASNAMYLTWRNLRGLQLHLRGATPVFAGRPSSYVVDLTGNGRDRFSVQMEFADSKPILVDVPANGGIASCRLALHGLPRGEHQPGRLTISTQYPLALFRAWCYVDCTREVLVFPDPGAPWIPPGDQGDRLDGRRSGGTGTADFAGLRGYRAGDQPAQIDWKSYARDRGLNTRLFSGQEASPMWIDWNSTPGVSVEHKLSRMTRAVLDAEARGLPYGLRTPEGTTQPAVGPRQRYRCLRQLATYGAAHG